MGRPKGSKSTYRFYTAKEKYGIITQILENKKSSESVSKETGINSGTLIRWVHQYLDGGIEALENKRKPGNQLAKYSSKKELSEIERLEYENLLLRIENERLKKGYTTKEADLAKRKK